MLFHQSIFAQKVLCYWLQPEFCFLFSDAMQCFFLFVFLFCFGFFEGGQEREGMLVHMWGACSDCTL